MEQIAWPKIWDFWLKTNAKEMCARTQTPTLGPEMIGRKLDLEITKGRLLMVTGSLAEMQQMDNPNKSVGTVGNLIIIPPTVDMVIPSSATSVTCWATKQNSVVGIRGMAKKRVPIMN